MSLKIINGVKFYTFYLSDPQIAAIITALQKRPLEESINAFMAIQEGIKENQELLKPPPPASAKADKPNGQPLVKEPEPEKLWQSEH